MLFKIFLNAFLSITTTDKNNTSKNNINIHHKPRQSSKKNKLRKQNQQRRLSKNELKKHDSKKVRVPPFLFIQFYTFSVISGDVRIVLPCSSFFVFTTVYILYDTHTEFLQDVYFLLCSEIVADWNILVQAANVILAYSTF